MKTEWNTYSLVDTNVWVYSVDTYDEFKHVMANEFFEDALEKESKLAVSTQILAEFANACIKLSKRDPSVPLADAEIVISALLDVDGIVKLTVEPGTVLTALKIQSRFGINFYDALIAATMKENGITKIYTEDRDFEKIEGITAINPFERHAKTI